MEASHSRKGSRSLRFLGLALTISLALAAFAAASASALSISNVEKNNGNFSWSGGRFTWETSTGNKGECQTVGGSGTFTSSTGGTGVLSGGSCKMITQWGAACTTAGQPEGKIVTSQLGVKLVYLDAAHTKFGLLLSAPVGGNFTQFACGGVLQYPWTGSVIAQITSPGLNVPSQKSTLVFEQTEGVQKYRNIEGAGSVYQLTQSSTTVGLSGVLTMTFPVSQTYIP